MEIQSFVSDEQKVQEMGVELKRLRQENKELHQLLDAMNFKYSNLQEHVEKMKQEMLGLSSSQSPAHQQFLMKGSHPIQQPKPNTSRILVRTNEASPSLIVKDGYHWKKYGQKVTKDNPSPRAYFRCSVAPICHVKKKVQRSADDQSILVATYEGEHNHPKPRPGESSGLEASEDESNKKSVTSHIHPAIALDLTLSMNNQINDSSENTGNPDVESSHNSIKNINSDTVDEYVNLLARDPNIQASLVGALANYVQNSYRSEG